MKNPFKRKPKLYAIPTTVVNSTSPELAAVLEKRRKPNPMYDPKPL